MNANEILTQLQSLGSEAYKKTICRHGVQEPVYGVKISELKKIQKKIKQDYQLALDLYNTGVYDAMYLAGLIADDMKMTKKDLKHWLKKATSPTLLEYTIPWVASESKHGHDLALEWIRSKKEDTASCGWSTLSNLVSIKDDSELNIKELKSLLKQVETVIHDQPNRVRYCMNGFVISVGSYVSSLTDTAIQTAKKVGKVEVDMGDTSCKTPDAVSYIQKVKQRGTIGKKRKTAKC